MLLIASSLRAAVPVVQVTEYRKRVIYHSPQIPGYTSWCTLWRDEPSGDLHVAFEQVTGPVKNVAGRKNVTAILTSTDEARTWKLTREVAARPTKPSADGDIYAAPVSTAFCGHGLVSLPDRTLVTGLWGVGKGDTGFVQRSTDGGESWSGPIYLADSAKYLTWPTVIHRLRDGRLILMAGVVELQKDRSPRSGDMVKGMFESRDEGKTWSKPIWIMPKKDGVCEESDFVELDSGDLLFIHRTEHYDAAGKYIDSVRTQSIVKRVGDGWEPGVVTAVPMPHSGFPELLKTREGIILHVGTDGIWFTPADLSTWTRLPIEGAGYYPRAMQLKDGRILVVGHVGSDDVYGKVDQAIVEQTFRLRVK
jgi:hypothetical protein